MGNNPEDVLADAVDLADTIMAGEADEGAGQLLAAMIVQLDVWLNPKRNLLGQSESPPSRWCGIV